MRLSECACVGAYLPCMQMHTRVRGLVHAGECNGGSALQEGLRATPMVYPLLYHIMH